MSQLPDSHAEYGYRLPERFASDKHSFQPAGCVSKKWLFFTLRPELNAYRAAVIRDFFTPDRLERCGLGSDDFLRVRIFSPEATAVILSDLRQLNFIP